MVHPRWLRHKLMLGLALVVGSVGLFFSGTLYGRRAYLNTVRMTERKLYELQQVNILIALLEQPIQAEPADATTELKQFQANTRLAQAFLKVYQKEHAETVHAGLDPDDGDQEIGLLQKLDDGLLELDTVLAQYH
ncbi:MAG: zraS 4, partial [Gemmataceae bacterium]|nr:zraS 4 [Gemmataceae bacterium]